MTKPQPNPSQTDTEPLKSCAYCRSKPETTTMHHGGVRSFVRCPVRDCAAHVFTTYEKWNRRTPAQTTGEGKWSSDRPTKPGWYWYRESPAAPANMFEFVGRGRTAEAAIHYTDRPTYRVSYIDHLFGEWCGPIASTPATNPDTVPEGSVVVSMENFVRILSLADTYVTNMDGDNIEDQELVERNWQLLQGDSDTGGSD